MSFSSLVFDLSLEETGNEGGELPTAEDVRERKVSIKLFLSGGLFQKKKRYSSPPRKGPRGFLKMRKTPDGCINNYSANNHIPAFSLAKNLRL